MRVQRPSSIRNLVPREHLPLLGIFVFLRALYVFLLTPIPIVFDLLGGLKYGLYHYYIQGFLRDCRFPGRIQLVDRILMPSNLISRTIQLGRRPLRVLSIHCDTASQPLRYTSRHFTNIKYTSPPTLPFPSSVNPTNYPVHSPHPNRLGTYPWHVSPLATTTRAHLPPRE